MTNNNYIKVTVKQKGSAWKATIDEIGIDYNINNSPEIYVNNTIIDNWYINNNTIAVRLDEFNIYTYQLYLSPANYPTNASMLGGSN